MIAAGSIALADGTGANVAVYTIANNTWSAIGSSSELPGPVTAMEVNAGNSSSIFAAGRCVPFCFPRSLSEIDEYQVNRWQRTIPLILERPSLDGFR